MPALLRRMFRSPATLAVIGVGAIVAIVVWAGPLLTIGGERPLESGPARFMLAAIVPMSTGIVWLIRSRTQEMLNAKVNQALGPLGLGPGVAAPRSTAETDAAGAQAVETLNTRFREAMGILRKRRFSSSRGRRWLYQLPWYVIIGPPGSGKTTAITNSGLTFPLADRLGRTAVGGIGGTRNCDWWFTDDAVLIDTAGRYTTQDSDPEPDKAGWLGFLRLLRKYRRRQPLNGVLVAIGIRDLSCATDEQRHDHAANVRERVRELYRELGARLPVYVLFTKADLIAGFVEYFDDLGREGRESVWGMTFQMDSPEPEPGYVGRFDSEFDALVSRLDERLLERVQREGDVERRALAFGFPQQVLSLKEMTGEFLRHVFQPSSFDEPILLRGAYFVSGTQVGTPLDRVTESMSRTFGIAHRPQPGLTGQTRSYFLGRLLREVVFGEAGLVDADPRIERRLRRVRRASYAVTAAIFAMASVVWVASFTSNLALIDRVHATAVAYGARADALHLERVEDSDLRPVAPLLARLRTIETGFGDTSEPPLLRAAFGLDQDPKLATQTRSAYRHALNSVLLPRLVLRLEKQLREAASDPDFEYEGLKVYLMLGRQGTLERETVRHWMSLDFANAFPTEHDAELRQSLGRDVDALLQSPMSDIGLNGELIESTRAALRKVPLAKRVLDGIVGGQAAAALPAWTIADNGGPGGGVMRRRSGRPLSAGIPGIYTREGFYGIFLPMLPKAVQTVLHDGWIMGLPAADAAPEEALGHDATTLYLQEFALRWDQLLGDITVKPVAGLEDSLRTLNTLAAPTSPIRLLVVSMAAETKLDAAPPGTVGAAGGPAAQGEPAQDKLAGLFKLQPPPNTPQGEAAHYTQDHFKSLQQLVDVPANSEPGAQPPIDSAIRDLGTLYHSLSQMQSSGAGGGSPMQSPLQSGSDGALAQVSAGAAGLPDPIRQWVLGVSKTSSSLSMDQAKQRLATLWSGTAGQACQRATARRYPFVRDAAEETPIGDFAKLFGRGGAIDSFFTQNLVASVDMSRDPWQWRPAGNPGVVVDRASLENFQRGAAIRDSMFQGGEMEPSFSFVATLGPLDRSVASASFQLGDKVLTAQRDQTSHLRFRWSADMDKASVVITTSGEPLPPLSQSGPWALFRLLDQATTESAGGSDRLRVNFTVDGHPVSLQLQADSTLNPLSSRLLSRFRCPTMQ